jgi:uncharacterized damage-inducible protein DinB
MNQHTLIELLYGKYAHANPIACVEGVPADLAGRRAQNLSHSVWEIVWHMNYWMDYEIHRIHGDDPPYPGHASESWPPDSPPSEPTWNREVARFNTLLEELADLAQSDEEALDRQVKPPSEITDPSHPQEAVTVLDVLWQTAVHNSYHIGQVALLRRALGIWPPQGGGDTW